MTEWKTRETIRPALRGMVLDVVATGEAEMKLEELESRIARMEKKRVDTFNELERAYKTMAEAEAKLAAAENLRLTTSRWLEKANDDKTAMQKRIAELEAALQECECFGPKHPPKKGG